MDYEDVLAEIIDDIFRLEGSFFDDKKDSYDEDCGGNCSNCDYYDECDLSEECDNYEELEYEPYPYDLRPYFNSGFDRAIFNKGTTVVFWKDGTKTVVRCQEGDTFDKEKGLAICFAKKMCGNDGSFNELFKDVLEDDYK